MAVVIPPGLYQAVYRWSLTGDPEEQVSTLGFSLPVGTSVEDHAEQVYVHAVGLGSLTPVAAMIANWTFVGVTLYHRTIAGDLTVAVYNQPISSAGGTPASPPNNCAVLIQKRTALAGVRNRGRMYLPPFGISETQISQTGMIESTEYIAIADRLEQWQTNMELADYNPVLLHADGGTPTPITSMVLATQIATQRRRMRN